MALPKGPCDTLETNGFSKSNLWQLTSFARYCFVSSDFSSFHKIWFWRPELSHDVVKLSDPLSRLSQMNLLSKMGAPCSHTHRCAWLHLLLRDAKLECLDVWPKAGRVPYLAEGLNLAFSPTQLLLSSTPGSIAASLVS